MEKKKRKKARGRGKGSQFERDICRELSRWWSRDRRDDLFWRSAQSGGRATFRRKKGAPTQGHYGDICATSKDGESLLDVITIELKRGYSAENIAHLLDYDPDWIPRWTQPVFDQWLQQAIDSHEAAGSFAWLLIQKRDKRHPIVFFPGYFYDAIKQQDLFPDKVNKTMSCRPYMRFKGKYIWRREKQFEFHPVDLCAVHWQDFLLTITPDDIRELAKRC